VLGFPASMIVAIRPIIPSVGIRVKASGTPKARFIRLSFIRVLVSPSPRNKVPWLRLPITANRLFMTYKVRKVGACVHFSPKSVAIMGLDRTIMAIVAGIRISEVYLMDDVYTVWSSSSSFSGFILEKAGNRTV